MNTFNLILKVVFYSFQCKLQFGHMAEYYKQNRNELSHKKLLRDFGAHEDLADEMLTDKGISFCKFQHIIRT